MGFINIRFSVLALIVIPSLAGLGLLAWGALSLIGWMTAPQVPVVQEVLTPLVEKPVVTFIDGLAEVSRAGGSWEEVFPGDELESQDTLRTSEDSYMDIRLWKGSVARLTGGTLVKMETLFQEKTSLEVVQGGLVTKIRRLTGDQSLEIRTSTVAGAVRGTELAVYDEEGRSTIYGLSGRVEVLTGPDRRGGIFLTGEDKALVENNSTDPQKMPMTPEEVAYFRRILDSLKESVVLAVSDQIRFDPNMATLSPGSETELDRLFKILASTKFKVKIVGHTADVGALQGQLDLSQARAESVRQYLIHRGMKADRLLAEGVGGTQPLVAADDPAQEKNRRVEFLILEESPE